MNMWHELAELGLEEREARFYVAVLSLGKASVTRASNHAKVNRTTGYDLARRLTDRGLLQAVDYGEDGRREDGTRTEFAAVDPTVLFEDLERRKTLLDGLVPQLHAIQSTARDRPKVRYFEGPTGIRSALFETLEWSSPLRGIFAMKDLFRVPGELALQEYVQGRKDRQLMLQVVRSAERDLPDQWPTSSEELRQARSAPPGQVFTMTTIIGASSVAVISSRKEQFAMMIDSPEYATTQSNLFDILWNVSATSNTQQ